jgi:hypothetical protein
MQICDRGVAIKVCLGTKSKHTLANSSALKPLSGMGFNGFNISCNRPVRPSHSLTFSNPFYREKSPACIQFATVFDGTGAMSLQWPSQPKSAALLQNMGVSHVNLNAFLREIRQ